MHNKNPQKTAKNTSEQNTHDMRGWRVEKGVEIIVLIIHKVHQSARGTKAEKDTISLKKKSHKNAHADHTPSH